MIRVLHSVSNMDRAGIETMLMNYYRHIDRSKVQFDFLANKSKPGAYDEEIKKMGGHIYISPGLNPIKFFKYKKEVKEILENDNKIKIVKITTLMNEIKKLITFLSFAISSRASKYSAIVCESTSFGSVKQDKARSSKVPSGSFSKAASNSPSAFSFTLFINSFTTV